MPDFQNPTGPLMPDDERAALAGALRRTRRSPVVDETMVEMAIDELPMPAPVRGARPGRRSRRRPSKAFWGGLRIGWVRAPRAADGELVTARLSLDLGAPLLEQLALVHLLADARTCSPIGGSSCASRGTPRSSALRRAAARLAVPGPARRAEPVVRAPRPVSTALTSRAAERTACCWPPGRSSPRRAGWSGSCGCPSRQPPDVLTEAVDRLVAARLGRLTARRTRSHRRVAVGPTALVT